MEAITQKHEDAHVLMLSDMFTAIPATTIRRYLRENGGDMERTAAALIEVNDKYVGEIQKKQSLSVSKDNNNIVSGLNPSPVPNPIDKAIEEKLKQIEVLQSKIEPKVLPPPDAKEQPAENTANPLNNIPKGIVSLQKEAEKAIQQGKEQKPAETKQTVVVSEESFEAWKAKRLAEAQAEVKVSEKIAEEKPVDDFAQSLAKSVTPPSPARFLNNSSFLASVFSHENSVIEAINSQLTTAYQRVFAEVEAKMAVQVAEIEKLNGEVKSRDEEVASLKARLEEKDKAVKEAQDKLGEANKTIEDLQKKLANPPTIEEQIKMSTKKVAESIQGTFDKSVSTALSVEGAVNSSLEVNRIANAIKKEIAIAFLKELNTARKNGDETASLSFSSLGASSPARPPSYAAAVLNKQ